MNDEKLDLRAQLASELGTCQASDLIFHIERDAVVVVAQELDLLEVAISVSEDNSSQIKAWMDFGMLKKPSLSQIDAWKSAPETPFSSVIARPFVLIQTRDPKSKSPS